MPSLSPGCGGYASESAWSGSGGGVSQVFARPPFQKGCGVPTGTQRLVPDVALEADTSPGNYVAENGSWWIVGGTSDAAPQWAGLAAALAQRSEEHTSELQSPCNLVCRLLLEKKKKKRK